MKTYKILDKDKIPIGFFLSKSDAESALKTHMNQGYIVEEK